MEDVLILGAGVHGAEMAEIVERVNRREPAWKLLGFVTPNDKLVGQQINGYPVLGTAEVLSEHPRARLVPDNEWPRSIEVPRERLGALIDPSAFVSRTATIGAGCVIYPDCYVGLNARLGDCVFVLSGCIINHDDVLADRVVLASGARLAGMVHVEEDCYLGQGCSIRQCVRIGRNSLVGMGAVVIEDVAPHSVMVGNPARKLRERT